MDDDNLMDVDFTDLDLNQEPVNQTLHNASVAESILNELENSSVRRYHRLMQLEAVIRRHERRRNQSSVAIPRFSGGTVGVSDDGVSFDGSNEVIISRQERRRNQNPVGILGLPSETVGILGLPSETVGASEDGVSVDGNNEVEVLERSEESGRGCKRDSSHLVTEDLGKNSDVNEVVKDGGGFYDCSICLEMANDPVVTVCGHLFCWPCFYQVSHIDSAKKECPVCKGEVSDNSVIPIYGNGGGDRVYESEYGLIIPPRPKAKRIESLRQQIVSGDFSQVYVAAAMRRIRISLAMDGTESRGGQNVAEEGGARARIQQVSRILTESALSTLRSARSDAERLIGDIESAIDVHFSRDRTTPFDGGDISVEQSNDQPPDLTVVDHTTSSTDVASSSSRQLRMLSSVQRRRSNIARVMDFYNSDAREARRRRLN